MSQFKEKFIELYQKHIHREGADKLLEYLSGLNRIFSRLLPAQDSMVLIAVAWLSIP